jgi:hypothetical protein
MLSAAEEVAAMEPLVKLALVEVAEVLLKNLLNLQGLLRQSQLVLLV